MFALYLLISWQIDNIKRAWYWTWLYDIYAYLIMWNRHVRKKVPYERYEPLLQYVRKPHKYIYDSRGLLRKRMVNVLIPKILELNPGTKEQYLLAEKELEDGVLEYLDKNGWWHNSFNPSENKFWHHDCKSICNVTVWQAYQLQIKWDRTKKKSETKND